MGDVNGLTMKIIITSMMDNSIILNQMEMERNKIQTEITFGKVNGKMELNGMEMEDVNGLTMKIMNTSMMDNSIILNQMEMEY